MGFLICSTVLASGAEAAVFTDASYQYTMSEFDEELGSEFLNDFSDCLDLGGGTGRRVDCDGSINLLQYGERGLVTYASSAEVVTAESLQFKTFASLNYEADAVGGPGTRFHSPLSAVSEGHAYLRDNWRIVTGAGSTGSIQFTFPIDGTTQYQFGDALNPVVSQETVLFGGAFPVSGGFAFGSDLTGFDDGDGDVAETVRLRFDVPLNSAFRLQLDQRSLVQLQALDDPNNLDGSAFGLTDFFNTATLQNIEVFDALGNGIEFMLETESGLAALEKFGNGSVVDPDEPGPMPAPIPLPAGLPIFLSALGVLGLVRRRRSNR